MARGEDDQLFDIAIIGGGINGCGLARDAAGRGLKVLLCEKDDLASATSSASTKLFHGGLRYLEFFEFRLVREALIEREVLLGMMPHISWPMRFIVPFDPTLRLENDISSLGKLLRYTLPFLRGRRPAWLVRTGLFMYDHLGGRKILPGTRSLDLRKHPAGRVLDARFTKAFEYSDCWIEDSRLVALNARDAFERGATVLTRTLCEKAERKDGLWQVTLADGDGRRTVRSRILINAAGPWVEKVLNERIQADNTEGVRLVRGSHIVTRRLFDHDQPYFFQLPDGRIIFAIPYETDYTLIGTTDADFTGDPGQVSCSPEERAYLVASASRFFREPLSEDDVIWSYSGVRPLYDDNASSATAATRDYVLKVTAPAGGAPLLSVFGGKITTYRRLAEHGLQKLAPYLNGAVKPWTAGAPLAGGDFPVDGVPLLVTRLRENYPFLDARWALRLVRAYGTGAGEMLGKAKRAEDLGRHFGWNLTEREVNWLRDREFAETAQDILWRRSKIGLRLSKAETVALETWLAANPP
ncbi:MAG: glycerol-3-phosphate dehydrogenase [Halocynthiibacter sp.]